MTDEATAVAEAWAKAAASWAKAEKSAREEAEAWKALARRMSRGRRVVWAARSESGKPEVIR